MKDRPTLPALMFALAFVAGCSASGTVDGPVAESPKERGGTLYGVVRMRDPDGNMHFNFAGTDVSTIGRKYHTVTNDSGFWALDSLPAGVFTIRISRPNWVMNQGLDSIGPLQFVGVDSFPVQSYAYELVRPLQAKISVDSFAVLDTNSSELGWAAVRVTCTVLDTFKSVVPQLYAIVGTDSSFHNETRTYGITTGVLYSQLLPPLPASHGQRVYWYVSAVVWQQGHGWPCFDSSKGSTYGPKTYAVSPVQSYVIP